MDTNSGTRYENPLSPYIYFGAPQTLRLYSCSVIHVTALTVYSLFYDDTFINITATTIIVIIVMVEVVVTKGSQETEVYSMA